MRENLVVRRQQAYVSTSVQTLRERKGSPPDGRGGCQFSLSGKARDAFGQPAFFLVGNRMTTVAFEKEVF